MLTRKITIGIRVLPEEKTALAQVATMERRNPSELVRELIRREAQQRGLWPPSKSEVGTATSNPT